MLSISRRSIGECCRRIATCLGEIVSWDVQCVLCGSSDGCDAMVVRKTALDILATIEFPSQYPASHL
jgi:hypothetical protein